jgi:hypothetical protein
MDSYEIAPTIPPQYLDADHCDERCSELTVHGAEEKEVDRTENVCMHVVCLSPIHL